MLPQPVEYVLERLENAGFAAFAVGGCVRDTLLGRVPGDWDVTTAARPEQVLALFDGCAIPTGLKHGTVTVRAEGMGIEVTTFCLLYTSPSPRDRTRSRMPSSA